MSVDVQTPGRRRLLALYPWLIALWVLLSAAMVVTVVDFTPSVEADFFFSTEDPQLASSRTIGELFPAGELILIGAIGADLGDPGYLAKVKALGDELAALRGVRTVRSLSRGPDTPAAAAGSPIWRRLLLGRDPAMSQLIAELQADADRPATVAAVEQALARHRAPGFELVASGVPFVVEQIRQALQHDLRTFSLAALLAFGLLIALVYRSGWIVAGALAACVGTCACTLAALWALGSSIGLLTANIVTIVFVLALSHVVFLTANARAELAALPVPGPIPAASADALEARRAAVDRGVAITLAASAWCTLTAFLGFASLLFSSAKPLRELGFAGSLGTLIALLVPFGLYPAFLQLFGRRFATGAAAKPWAALPGRPHGAWLALSVAAAALALPFLSRLDTDPSLLTYFAPDGAIRAGLERVDAQGGSSPLLLVVAAPGDLPLDQGEFPARLAALQAACDADAAVGSCLSLEVLLAEARARNPLANFLAPTQLVDLLMGDQFEKVGRGFLTDDRRQALFFLRMRESGREEPRRVVIERLRGAVAEAGLELRHTGGLYELQASLGELVGESVGRGLLGLLLLFVPIALGVARGLRRAFAMIASLALVPPMMLGLLVLLGLPLDVISSPAANVALGMGIDSMIHLTMAVRRRLAAGDGEEAAWAAARSRLWPAILGGIGILAAGFALFLLSSFPPTQRFGASVAVGLLVSALISVWVLPRLAQPWRAAS